MALLPSLLRELENPNLSVDNRVELLCEAAKVLEYKGEYDEAQKLLGDYWTHIGERPNVDNLQPNTAGEILLRAGVLTSAIGSKREIADSQETAKNLIFESLAIFRSRHYRKKIAEAQTELALCYWRTGELNNARDLLNESLALLTTYGDVRAKTVIRLGIVECEAANYSKALRGLTESAALFEKINNDTLKGSYHTILGTVLRHLWEAKRHGDYLDRALIEYAAASHHYERSGHLCYWANVENQLGLIYFNLNRCDEAHQHLNRVRRIHISLKDAGTVAQVDETRATVFLKQGRNKEAEEAARAAVLRQEKTGRHLLITEALITHGRALARLKRYGAALIAFRRAFDLAELMGSNNWATDASLAAFRELGEHLAVMESAHVLPASGLSKKTNQSLEHDAIKLALENAKGSVVRAARSLGISFQSLTYMLNTRHKDLLVYRTPVRRRPRK